MNTKCWKLTDSQVALRSINCTRTALKMWVRNRVVEITRLADRSNWRYVSSKYMVADIGTRKGAKIADVGPNSTWYQGYHWMRELDANLPLKTIEEVVLSNNEKCDENSEKVLTDFAGENAPSLISRYVPGEVSARYKFFKYLVAPNKFRLRTTLRIFGLVFLLIQKIRKKHRGRKNLFLLLKKRDFSVSLVCREKVNL